MIKFLNNCGLYTKAQYYALLEQKNQLDEKVKNYNLLIFNFDELLKNYGPQALNSLFYKMVNVVRNTPDKRFLLPRWIIRLNSAQTSIVV